MKYSTDFLVIGSGISGLSFAIKAARLGSVTIITKKAKVDTATNLAQGGIAAVLSPEDSFALHIEDTLRSGAGLCHEDIVRLVVETGPARIEEYPLARIIGISSPSINSLLNSKRTSLILSFS